MVDEPSANRTDSRRWPRRRVLKTTAGLALAAGIAGCSSGGGGGNGGDGTDSPGDTGENTDGSNGDDMDTETETETESTPDTSPVAFDRLWREDIDFQDVISSRNFGADATPDGVFFGAEWGFAALNLNDGSRMWEKDEWSGFFDIQADSNGVIAYTKSFDVVSFDPSDGTERWRKSTSGSENSRFSAALAPSYFVAQSANGLVVYERSSGSVATEITLDGDPRDIVATDSGVAISARFGGAVTVYDIPSGSERWSNDLALFGLAVADDQLIGLNAPAGQPVSLTALDRETGKTVWSQEVGDIGIANVTIEDGVALFIAGDFTEPKTLYAHNIDDGTQAWTKDVGDVRQPFAAVDSGTVIAPGLTDNNRAKIRAYDLQSGEQLAETDGGLSVTEAAAVDRVFLEIELATVTAYEF